MFIAGVSWVKQNNNRGIREAQRIYRHTAGKLGRLETLGNTAKTPLGKQDKGNKTTHSDQETRDYQSRTGSNQKTRISNSKTSQRGTGEARSVITDGKHRHIN